MTKDRIEKLIAKGELKTALDNLLDWTKGKTELSDIHNLVLSNAGRLADLERKRIGGELNPQEEAQTVNQIRNAVLGALEQVPPAVSISSTPEFSQLRKDPLLLDFVKKQGDAYEHNHTLFTDFWEEVQQKYGKLGARDLLAILEEVHQALQEIPQLAMKFAVQHTGKWRTSEWLNFKDEIEENYGAVMSGKELAGGG